MTSFFYLSAKPFAVWNQFAMRIVWNRGRVRVWNQLKAVC